MLNLGMLYLLPSYLDVNALFKVLWRRQAEEMSH